MNDLRSAVGASSACREVTLDGVRLAFDDDGAGPALVCLHAIGHGAGDFAEMRRRLRDRYRVLALDWPGQGSSAPDHVPASAARYADLLARFLDAADVGRPVLIGNSIGGAAAMRYAATHPGRARALVLEDPGGLVPVDRVVRLFTAALARFFAAGARGARWFPRAFALYYRMVLPTPAAAAQRARIVASAGEIAPVLRDAWLSFGRPEADLRALVPRITCPVLFAWAARDRLVPLGRCRPAIGLFPDARLEVFPAGHAAHLETPDAFEASLVRFLEGLATEGTADEARARLG